MTTGTTTAVDGFVRVGALNLHYLEWGEAGAPPVIMVHGLSGNAHNFDNLAPYLATRYHVVSVDVRGRGDSDWAADANYSNDAYIADLEGLRQALGFERISLVGTSLGGRISMSYAGTYPDRVERTVLNDIGPDIDPRGGARIAESTRDAVTSFGTMDEVIAWHREQRVGFSSLGEADQRAFAGHAVKSLPGGGYTWKMDPAVRADPRRPDPGNVMEAGPANPRARCCWSGEGTATSCRRRRPSGWSQACRTVAWWRSPAWVMPPP